MINNALKLPLVAFILFLIFLILKLTEIGIVSDWSWWWVTAPMWIAFIIQIIVYSIVFYFLLKKKKQREFSARDFMERLREAQKIQDKQRKKGL